MNAAWAWIRVRLAGVGLALAAIVGGSFALAYVFKSCQPEPKPKIPVEVQKRIDSLAITKAAFDSGQKAGLGRIVHDTVRAIVYKTRAAESETRAEIANTTADSLAAQAALAKTADSAAVAWKAAYDVRTVEADQWRITAARNDSAYQAERSARVEALQLYDGAVKRLQSTELVNVDLRKAIAKLEQPCRILGPIPCPSRTVTLILSTVAAGTAGIMAGKR